MHANSGPFAGMAILKGSFRRRYALFSLIVSRTGSPSGFQLLLIAQSAADYTECPSLVADVWSTSNPLHLSELVNTLWDSMKSATNTRQIAG